MGQCSTWMIIAPRHHADVSVPLSAVSIVAYQHLCDTFDYLLMTCSHYRPEYSCDLQLTVKNPVIAAGGPSSSWFFVATRDRLHVSQQITKLPIVDLYPIIQVAADTVVGIVAKLLLDCGNPSCPRLMPPCRGSYGACVRTPTCLDRVCPFLFNLF